MEERMLASGLDAVTQLPWGSHFCQFYSGTQELIEAVGPYFAAGLRANERCVWVAGEPLAAEQARALFSGALPGLDRHIISGQMGFAAGLREVSAAGYAGLRLAGERLCALAGRSALTLCTYGLQNCRAHAVIEAVRGHHFALARHDGQWERIESASGRTRELEHALHGRDQFLAMLAHELRGPLAPIRTAAQLVRLLSPSHTDLLSASDVLERQVLHLSRLVEDLLDGARVTHGVITLRKQCLAVDSALMRCIESAQPSVAARRQALTFSLPAEPLFVQADPTRLAQILGNLLDNAAKYTPEGGRIEVSAQAEGTQAVIRVSDSGIGIPPGMLTQVFDVFAQVEPAVDRSKGGLGLGLALVRRLVELHGGSVEAASEGEGKGAQFTVRLPRSEPPGPSATPPRRLVATQRRILVVDDNSDSTTTMAMALKLLGHEVRTALSGASALEAAKQFQPEVVLLDIGLPGMDGYEVARRLRELPATRHARLIALTGYGREEDRRRGREAGFDEYQLKPIAPETLKELLSVRSLH